ncbi:MAG: BrnA antitoxin family protein [Kiritimatiellae bacterium]|nr:BrnA antitoxin family protein [Kiritimatiellia bacterium]
MNNFKTEDEERDFWKNNSPLDFFDTESAKQGIFPNLKPTLKSVSIRLPQSMIDDLKILANKRDIPYQSLAKMYLSWGIQSERKNSKLT